MRTALILLALTFLLPFCCRADALGDFAERLEHTEKLRTVSADFTQVRHLVDLDMDVRITGSMICDVSGRLRWQVDSPIRSVTLIHGDSMEHFDGATGKTVKVTARDFPWMKVLNECFSDWLSADIRKLSAGKKFVLSVPEKQTLRLMPCGAPYSEFMRSVDITFRPDLSAVASVLIVEPSGDTMKIRFERVRENFDVPAKSWDLPEK